MTDILNLITPFFGLIAIGFFCGRTLKKPKEGLAWLSFFLIYVALPALFYKIIATTPIESFIKNISYPLTMSAVTLSVFILSFVLARTAFKRTQGEATIQGVMASYANIGYMGPALVLSALGQAAATPLALIFTLENALIFTLVPMMMALSVERTSLRDTFIRIIKRVFLHPFILATFAGLISASFNIHPPEPIDNLLIFLKNAAAPCALFAMGVTLGTRPLKALSIPVLTQVFLKLCLHPILVFLAMTTLNFPPLWVATAVLLASLPTALNVYILAEQYQQDVETASAGVLLSTLISVVTVSYCLVLFAT